MKTSHGSNEMRVSMRGEHGHYTKLGSAYDDEYTEFEVVPQYLWWPYTLDEKPGFLHTLKVCTLHQGMQR